MASSTRSPIAARLCVEGAFPADDLEGVTDAFFSLDHGYSFSHVSCDAERLFRRPASELQGKLLWDVFPDAQGSEFEHYCRRAMTTGERVRFVVHDTAPDERWFEVRASPSSEGLSVYVHDVTERARAEEEGRRERELRDLVIRNANVGVWYCPLPFDGIVCDEIVREHLFIPKDARVTIDSFYDCLHPEDRERTRAAVNASVATAQSYDVEYRTVSPDRHTIRWIHAIGRTFRDHQGIPIRFDGVTIDVSERKRTELALRENEERYRLAMRATNDLIWDWDLLTSHVLWNPTLRERFGFAVDPASSKLTFWIQHIHPDDRQRVLASIFSVIRDPKREHWQEEYRFERADGSWVDVFDRGYVLRDASGNGVRMIGAVQDLTDRKAAVRDRERTIEAERAARSEAERQSRLKDELLAGLSHELRTPLNAILGWAHILRMRQPADSEALHGLEVITRNARAQASLVDELLDMGRLTAGKLTLHMEPLDLAAVVEAAIDTIRPAAEAKRVHLGVLVLAQDCRIVGDAARLQQVLRNLFDNAVKFTPSGGAVDVVVEQNGVARIRVADTGEGIPPEFLPNVFERFRQGDASASRRHGGLGLGLSIVKQLVELHGGTVSAASPGVDKGATFEVTLPLLGAATQGAARRPLTTALAGRGGGTPQTPALDVSGLRVLVVDDDLDSRSFVARLLEERSAVVAVASNADEAMRLVESGPFDVVLSDIGMPGEDGYSLVQRIHALEKQSGRDLPAIAVTAYARGDDRDRAMASGFLSHVSKPIDPAELVTVVATAARRVGRGGLGAVVGASS